MRPVSKKRAAVNRVRGPVVAAMRELQPWCARCGQNTEINGHERAGRTHGADITKPEDLLCNPCNGWCEDHPRQAAWDGWKVSAKHPRDPLLLPGEARDNIGDVVLSMVLS